MALFKKSASIMLEKSLTPLISVVILMALFSVVDSNVLASISAGGRNKIEKVSVFKRDDGSGREVRISTAKRPTFTVFRLSNPMRVVIDLASGDLAAIDGPIMIQDGIIDQVSVRQFNTRSRSIARIIVGFESEQNYSIKTEEGAVVLYTTPPLNKNIESSIPAPARPVDKAAQKRFEQTKRDAERASKNAIKQKAIADHAVQQARQQQQAVQRVTAEANRLRKEANHARDEAFRLRQESKQVAQKEQSRAREIARQAEKKALQLASDQVHIEQQRARLERLSMAAEQQRRDAEQKAAKARVGHRKQQVLLEKELLAAKQDRIQMRAAKIRAEKAELQAKDAVKEASVARKLADQTRIENAKKRVKIAQREKHVADELSNARLAIANDRLQLSQEREQAEGLIATQEQAILERSRELSDQDAKLRQNKAAAQIQKVAAEKQLALRAKQLELRETELITEKNEINEKLNAAHKALAASTKLQLTSNDVRNRENNLVPREVVAPILLGVEAGSKENSIQINLQGTPQFEVERIENPPRLVIDLLGVQKNHKKQRSTFYSSTVKKVRLGVQKRGTRVVLDLSNSALSHRVVANKNGVQVILYPKVKIATASKVARQKTTPKKPKESSLAAGLSAVDFTAKGAVSTITLTVDESSKVKINDRSKKSWILSMPGILVAKKLQQRLNTEGYNTSVRAVSIYQSAGNIAKVVVNLTGPATYQLKRLAGKIVWQINGTKTTPLYAKKELGNTRNGGSVATSISQTAGFAKDAVILTKSAPTQSRSSKKRINLDLKDADIVNVIRLLADVSGENIITSDAVKGKVTMHIKNVPWDVALDTILRTKGYDKERRDNIMRIAPAKDLEKQREMDAAKRVSREENEPTVIKIITVNYAPAESLVEQLKPLLSKRGQVQVDERTNTLIVEDIRSNINRLVELTRRLDRQTPQVLIEARIVEASTNYLEQLGIQWGGLGQATDATGNGTGLPFPGNITASGAASTNQDASSGNTNPAGYAVNLPAPIGSGSGGGLGFIFGSAGGSQILNLRLSALEERGEGKIISSPRITTLDNIKATISQGVDVPVSVVSAAGTNTRFIKARLSLEVTPHVTNDGTVALSIKVSKDEPDFVRTGTDGTPSIIKKEVNTEVLVKDGETTVIGGIYTRNTSESSSGIPFLSDLPLVGWLFKNKRVEDSRTELLIFVTPRIVNRGASRVDSSGVMHGRSADEARLGSSSR